MLDKSKIIKLLSLTQSDNDNEALSAIRMANKILRANEITWDAFMGHKTTNEKEPYGHSGWPEYHGVSSKIEYILNNYPVWFDPKFIRDLQVQLKLRGKLSPKQVQALDKIYHKIFNQ
jgi:hypothetical protein